MSGKTVVPEEAVEAAARAMAILYDHDGCFLEVDAWNAQEEWERDAHPESYPGSTIEDCAYWIEKTRAALEAAAPFIAAKALEGAADRFEQRSETLLKTMTNMAGHPDTTPDDVVRYGAYSAEANTTEHWLRARAAAVRGEG